jgi:hypothetical protein
MLVHVMYVLFLGFDSDVLPLLYPILRILLTDSVRVTVPSFFLPFQNIYYQRLDPAGSPHKRTTP